MLTLDSILWILLAIVVVFIFLEIYRRYFERLICGIVVNIEHLYSSDKKTPFTGIEVQDEKGKIFYVAVTDHRGFDFGVGYRIAFRRRFNLGYPYTKTTIEEGSRGINTVTTEFVEYYVLSQFEILFVNEARAARR